MTARDVLHPGGAAIGLWAIIPSPVTAELVARSGPDYVVVDQQHGAVGPGELLAMLQAVQGAGVPALVRVGSHDPWVIGHALDLGAEGVIVRWSTGRRRPPRSSRPAATRPTAGARGAASGAKRTPTRSCSP